MSEHFNRLTPAEAERLAMLAEECADAIQVIGKILRHGYDSHHPNEPNVTNRQLLVAELRDVNAVLGAMGRAELSNANLNGGCLVETWARKLRFTHHQDGGEA